MTETVDDIRVLAAGGLLIRTCAESSAVGTLLIHRPRHGDWSFPKGKLDPGETLEQAALREVYEETALRCELGSWLGVVDYPLSGGGLKRTTYWLMQPRSDDGFIAGAEVDAVRWLPLEDAAEVVTHPLDRALARRAVAALES
ncbi:NUDIX hydrolase [Ruania suaedae]|uniref:NUDIX hydrolase n=1 Tax=Ruania suaedae TaxID=2897774 RepID=UPI001E524B28|nr:NUDIX hydrolase [Ruania suaedae]UFU03857.1 NUDIX hydrolase [Ruania suaedae]